MWSNSSVDGYLVQVSIIDSRIDLPKGAPVFVEDLQEVKLLKGNSNKIIFSFPLIYDVNPSDTQ